MSSVRERATLVEVPTTLRVITSTARAPHWTIEEAVTEIGRRRQLVTWNHDFSRPNCRQLRQFRVVLGLLLLGCLGGYRMCSRSEHA